MARCKISAVKSLQKGLKKRKKFVVKPRVQVIPYGSKESEAEQQDYMIRSFKAATDHALQEKRDKKLPIARYDAVRDVAYIEYHDGTTQE